VSKQTELEIAYVLSFSAEAARGSLAFHRDAALRDTQRII
jgi:hypothetical protein